MPRRTNQTNWIEFGFFKATQDLLNFYSKQEIRDLLEEDFKISEEQDGKKKEQETDD